MELWDLIRALVIAGTDVILTTQYLDEADHLAGLVAIIDRGRTLAVGTPAELKRRIGGSVVEVHARDGKDLPKLALGRLGLGEVQINTPARRVTISVDAGADGLISAVQSVKADELEIEDIALRQPNLDEVFLALTGAGVKTQ